MSSVTPRDGLSPHISLSLNLWNNKSDNYFLVVFVGAEVVVDENGVGEAEIVGVVGSWHNYKCGLPQPTAL